MPAPATRTQLFLDAGDPAESRRAFAVLGRLDGQTTNPSLIASNPEIKRRIESGQKLSWQEATDFYRRTIQEIAAVTDGPLSIEVFADETSTVADLLAQGRVMATWTPSSYVKYPTTTAGLEAAEKSVAEGIRVNLTLCFAQEQAAAVYAATQGTRLPAFVSPFVGRYDDRGFCGMDLIANLLRMLGPGDGHLQTLTASVRNVDHLLYAFHLGSPLVTAPLKVYEQWAQAGFPIPEGAYEYPRGILKPIPYREVPLGRPWRSYDIRHEMTDVGQKKFVDAWLSLIAPEEAPKPAGR
jgi:transaldolase